MSTMTEPEVTQEAVVPEVRYKHLHRGRWTARVGCNGVCGHTRKVVRTEPLHSLPRCPDCTEALLNGTDIPCVQCMTGMR